MSLKQKDPGEKCFMEKRFAEACLRYGIEAVDHDHESGLDYYLPAFNTYVELKQFHSSRIAEQMSRRDAVIAIQGVEAIVAFEKMLNAAWLSGDKNGRRV